MRFISKLLFCTCIASLLVIVGCSHAAEVGGSWTGSMKGTNAGRAGSTQMEITFEQTRRGLSGTMTCHTTTGPWGILEGNTLTIRTGSVSGNTVAFRGDMNVPGGTVAAHFKGTLEGTTIKGTADLNVGSVMGGDTYLGDFELTRK
jgi:hypothetical protein